jgi:hypothetical protein
MTFSIKTFIDENEVDRVFFSGVAWLHLSGYVNSQNSSMGSSEHTHNMYQDNITAFISLLEEDERDCWCQQDGAWRHTSNETRFSW